MSAILEGTKGTTVEKKHMEPAEVLALADKAGLWYPMGSDAQALHGRARLAEFARLVETETRTAIGAASELSAGLGVELNEDQKTTLWLGAFRYYCGRMTYAVGDFCEILIAVWPELPDRTRALIQRDLTEEFQHDDEQRADDVAGTRHYKRLGHDVDRKQWEKVRALWGTPNVEVQGPGAASLRTVPCNDGLAGAPTEKAK